MFSMWQWLSFASGTDISKLENKVSLMLIKSGRKMNDVETKFGCVVIYYNSSSSLGFIR